MPTSNVQPRCTLDSSDVALLELASRGIPVERIGRELKVSGRTVRRRLRDICSRLGVDRPIEAVVWAARHRYI